MLLIAREPMAYWVGLWLMVSLKGCAVYMLAVLLSATCLRYRPAMRAMCWLLVIASFAWFSLTEYAAGSSRPADFLIAAVPDPVLSLIFHACLGIAAVLLGLVVHSVIRLQLLRRYASPLDVSLSLAHPSGILYGPWMTHRVGLYASAQVTSPTSFGVFTPAIIVPQNTPGTIYRSFTRTAAVHEFITVLRFDALWILLVRLVQCLYFAHPAVWLAFRHYSTAREQVCDLWTLRTLGQAAEYERCLMCLADCSDPIGPMRLDAPMSRGGRSTTHRRIATFQNDDRPRSLSLRATALALFVWMIALSCLAGIEWPHNDWRNGPLLRVEASFVSLSLALALWSGLTIAAIVIRARRPRLALLTDGLAGQSRQTIADCIRWLTREWEDVRPILSLTARRLEPVLVIVLLIAATMMMWIMIGQPDSNVRNSVGIAPEARVYEPRWHQE